MKNFCNASKEELLNVKGGTEPPENEPIVIIGDGQQYNEEGTYDNYNFPLEDQPFDESDANQNLIVKK